MYMFRAYQSPYMGTDCGPQWDQMPNFASRNQSGHWYSRRESKLASNFFAIAIQLLCKK